MECANAVVWPAVFHFQCDDSYQHITLHHVSLTSFPTSSEAGVNIALCSLIKVFIVSLLLQEAHQCIDLQVLSC